MKKLLIVCLVISLNSCNSKKEEGIKKNNQLEKLEILKDEVEGKFQLVNSNNEFDTRDNLLIKKTRRQFIFSEVH